MLCQMVLYLLQFPLSDGAVPVTGPIKYQMVFYLLQVP
jgi:hypothetical protein